MPNSKLIIFFECWKQKLFNMIPQINGIIYRKLFDNLNN